MKSPQEIAAAYDDVADHYDDGYARALDEAEDIVIADLLPWGADNVLDLGCGNGKGLELLQKKPSPRLSKYTGIDISTGMIETAKRRFPSHTWIVGDMLTDVPPHVRYDVVMSLFCSANYVPFRHVVQRAWDSLALGGRTLLMSITANRYRRFPALVFQDDTIPVNSESAMLWYMKDVGFEGVNVYGLGNIIIDALAPTLSAGTLAAVMRERIADEDQPIYLIATGTKPA